MGDFEGLYNKLCHLNIERNASMRSYTTMKTGGACALLARVQNEDELLECISECKSHGVNYFILGNGSNVLAGDDGVEMLVIKLDGEMKESFILGTAVTAGGGVGLMGLSKATVEGGLMGLEWAGGIPGTVGGAVAMNAGAYGSDISSCLVAVRVLRGESVETISVSAGDMGYRKSAFCAPESIVISATFMLKQDDGGAKGRYEEYLERRHSKQPLNYPSAGSTFKRPEGHFAGKLIEDAGLKGVSVGGAIVSQKHAGFIVNGGTATTNDVLALIELVKKRVYESSGILLETEVKLI